MWGCARTPGCCLRDDSALSGVDISWDVFWPAVVGVTPSTCDNLYIGRMPFLGWFRLLVYSNWWHKLKKPFLLCTYTVFIVLYSLYFSKFFSFDLLLNNKKFKIHFQDILVDLDNLLFIFSAKLVQQFQVVQIVWQHRMSTSRLTRQRSQHLACSALHVGTG